MGGVLSRWRKKQSTLEILADLQGKIDALEQSRKISVEKQKRLIGSLILYSVLLYIVAACLFYFYYMPAAWKDRIKYSLPLAAFPFLVWLTKRFLHWYFVKRIKKNELALEELLVRKKTILEEVMENETYKKAKEILEKYDPERFKALETPATKTPVQKTPQGQELRQRNVARLPGPQETPHRMPGGATPMTTPYGPRPGLGAAAQAQRNGNMGTPGAPAPCGPPLPRPVLPRERSVMDRLVEYLVGDGPQNRYALVCKQCYSHNGMAMKEEFEFISFRCCYCYTINPARKQRPSAPRLEGMSPAPTQKPAPRPAPQTLTRRGKDTESEDSLDTDDQDPATSNKNPPQVKKEDISDVKDIKREN